MSKIKDNFLRRYLPMWAKETVLADNKRLQKRVAYLEQQTNCLRAYIEGLEFAVKEGCRQCLTKEKS